MSYEISDVTEREKKYLCNTFSRLPVAIAKGKGMYLWDIKGVKYLDMFAGIGVNSAGHCNDKVVNAIKEQAEILMHTSNWLYTLPQIELAEKLVELTGMEKVFFTNDGTEANEAAIKLVRKGNKKEIIAMKNDFHGRTLGALGLTWKEKFRKPFEPLLSDMKFVDYNNIDALRNAVTEKTGAVILEPVQSESGVLIPDKGYLKEVRELTQEKDILLIVDEVATGFGRTGRLFCFQHEGIKPDILCTAKALGGGFPVGAMLCRGVDFNPGEHGGTYIGNPLACAAANASVSVILEENLTENSRDVGEYLLNKLLKEGFDARGLGLMLGVHSDDPKKDVLSLINEGVLCIYSDKTIRLLPPLIINKKEADFFIEKLNLIS